MAYVLKKITTDDPFVDYIIYHSKYLALNCVTKNDILIISVTFIVTKEFQSGNFGSHSLLKT